MKEGRKKHCLLVETPDRSISRCIEGLFLRRDIDRVNCFGSSWSIGMHSRRRKRNFAKTLGWRLDGVSGIRNRASGFGISWSIWMLSHGRTRSYAKTLG